MSQKNLDAAGDIFAAGYHAAEGDKDFEELCRDVFLAGARVGANHGQGLGHLAYQRLGGRSRAGSPTGSFATEKSFTFAGGTSSSSSVGGQSRPAQGAQPSEQTVPSLCVAREPQPYHSVPVHVPPVPPPSLPTCFAFSPLLISPPSTLSFGTGGAVKLSQMMF